MGKLRSRRTDDVTGDAEAGDDVASECRRPKVGQLRLDGLEC